MHGITDRNIIKILGDLFPEKTMLQRKREEYVNAIQGWHFPDDVIKEAAESGKLLHLDYEFGVNCSLGCWYCFRQDDERDTGKILSFSEWKDVVRQARDLGVTDMKLLGAGELTEHKKFFRSLEFVKTNGITPLLFTATHVIGSDSLAEKFHGMTGVEMAKELDELGVSVMVKVNSFVPEVQDEIVDVKGYSQLRNTGLRRLIQQGLNEHNPTRLGLEVAMMNTDPLELFEIYKLKSALNLYIDLDPFMPCGCTRTVEKAEKFDLSMKERMMIYEKVYRFNIESGIPFRGVSPYAGGQECSQLGYGLYVNVRGEVFPCPGSHSRLGNVREKPLAQIWAENLTRQKYSGSLSHGCPYREEAGILYLGWDEDIEKKVKRG